MTKIEYLAKLFSESKLFLTGGKVPTHYAFWWYPSEEIKVVSFFTHSPATVLKGTQYTNYKYGSTDSYLNPPLLIPKHNFQSSEKYLRNSNIDPDLFCEQFKCPSLEIGHLYAVRAFTQMMTDPAASREFIISMICEKEGSFLKSLGVADFEEKNKTEFFKNAASFFDDPSFINKIEKMEEIDLNWLDKFIAALEDEANLNHFKKISKLINEREAGNLNETENTEYEDALKILENSF